MQTDMINTLETSARTDSSYNINNTYYTNTLVIILQLTAIQHKRRHTDYPASITNVFIFSTEMIASSGHIRSRAVCCGM